MSKLRIATFNVESLGEHSAAAAPLAARIAVLRPQFARLEADIICLQEVDAEDSSDGMGRSLIALDELLAGTPHAEYFRSVSMSPHGHYPAERHNLVILSRFPIDQTWQVRHDIVPPLGYSSVTAVPQPAGVIEARFDRPLLYAAMPLPGGRRLHVLNVHLKAPLAAAIPGQKQSAFAWRSTQGWAEGFFIAAMKRAGQALEARLVVDRLLDQDPEAMIAVCGDFNADSWEVPVRIVLGSQEDTNNRLLARRSLTPVELKVSKPRRYSVLHDGRPVMLDHILASPALSALLSEAQVHNEYLVDEVLSHPEARRPAESFHAPLLAEFDLAA